MAAMVDTAVTEVMVDTEDTDANIVGKYIRTQLGLYINCKGLLVSPTCLRIHFMMTISRHLQAYSANCLGEVVGFANDSWTKLTPTPNV